MVSEEQNMLVVVTQVAPIQNTTSSTLEGITVDLAPYCQSMTTPKRFEMDTVITKGKILTSVNIAISFLGLRLPTFSANFTNQDNMARYVMSGVPVLERLFSLMQLSHYMHTNFSI